MSHEDYMRIALEEAEIAKREGNRAFSAVLVKDGQVVARAHNRVLTTKDPTAHAELDLIKNYCTEKKVSDLNDCVLYSTCEPCPMCASAIVWANVGMVVYGCDNLEGPCTYARQNKLSFEDIVQASGKEIIIKKHVLRDECRESFY